MNSTPRQISKASFYKAGGFSNSHQFRKANGNDWTYWSYER